MGLCTACGLDEATTPTEGGGEVSGVYGMIPHSVDSVVCGSDKRFRASYQHLLFIVCV